MLNFTDELNALWTQEEETILSALEADLAAADWFLSDDDAVVELQVLLRGRTVGIC